MCKRVGAPSPARQMRDRAGAAKTPAGCVTRRHKDPPMTRKLAIAALALTVVALPALAKNKTTRLERIQACRAKAAAELKAGMKECRSIHGQNSQTPAMNTCTAVV